MPPTHIAVYKFKDYDSLEVMIGTPYDVARQGTDWKKRKLHESKLGKKECLDRTLKVASEYFESIGQGGAKFMGSGANGYRLALKKEREQQLYEAIQNFSEEVEWPPHFFQKPFFQKPL